MSLVPAAVVTGSTLYLRDTSAAHDGGEIVEAARGPMKVA
jgi:hypothetical protein